MKFLTKEVQIALVAILGLVLLFFGLQFLKGLSFFSTGNNYYITFENVSGLGVSSPVYADGYKIGVVKHVEYDYSRTKSILAEVELDKQMGVPVGTTAEIVSDMLGNVQVNLILADSKEMLEHGGRIHGLTNPGAMGKIAQMVPAIEKMLPKLDSIMASLNTIMADPSITGSLHNIQDVSGNLKTTTSELNTLLAGLNKQVPTTLTKADGLLDNATAVAGKLNDMELEKTMARVNTTLANVEHLTNTLNESMSGKKGSLGLLLNDDQLYNNLNNTMRDADSLMINFKQHPKRYIHFSVFGKKDK